MKKQKRVNLSYNLNWTYGISLKELREDIAKIEKLGATHVDIELDYLYDDCNIKIEAICERLETDKEFADRQLADKEREKRIKESELKKMNELLKKYGK